MEDDFNNEYFNFDTSLDANQTLNLSKLEDKIKLDFDYEMNNLKLEYNDSSLSYSDEKSNQKIINYDSYYDKLRPLPKIVPSDDPKLAKFNESIYDKEFEEIENYEINKEKEKFKVANFIKRLVSKQKRRFQDSNYDLDMSYVTERVIAMGYPSSGIETMYRNSVSDITSFFHEKHNDMVKIYNLCLEKDRIYDKKIFPKSKVGLFPATDHNPCPIKLILEFCCDICLYLIRNPKGVAAVHCKAGKGRSGVMICSYLIFSGLCGNSEKAFRYYARVRTKNNTGITIASQKRYIRYFETFLQSNFYRPYINLIPKIIRGHFSFLIDNNDTIKIRNILESFQKQKSYFISANKFKLKGVKLGPFPKGKELKMKICNFVDSKFALNKNILNETKEQDSNGNIFYELYFNPELVVFSDIRIKIKKELNFFLWVNLWYSTWELIKDLYDAKFGKLIKDNTPKEDIKKIEEDKKEEEKEDKKDENSNDDSHKQSLYEIIFKLKHNTDLNELIDTINKKMDLGIDRKNLTIKLDSYGFDKFKEIDDYPNLQMEIYYCLCEK